MILDPLGFSQPRTEVEGRSVIGSFDPAPRAAQGALTFLERALPFKELSLLAQADRRVPDPVYAAHRWWARRPAAAMRGVLIAAALPQKIEDAEFWRLFASDAPYLKGMQVYDLSVVR